MNYKTKASLIFIVLAVADAGSFLVTTNLKDGLAAFEVNLMYRYFGLAPTLVFGVLAHAAILYYYYNPFFKNRAINFSFANMFVIVCIAHLVGTVANVHSYMSYTPPALSPTGEIEIKDRPPTQDELNAALLLILVPVMIFLTVQELAFKLWCKMDDEFNFSKVSLREDLKRASIWLYRIDVSAELAIEVVLFGILARVLGKYVLNDLLSADIGLWYWTAFGISCAVYLWCEKRLKEWKT